MITEDPLLGHRLPALSTQNHNCNFSGIQGFAKSLPEERAGSDAARSLSVLIQKIDSRRADHSSASPDSNILPEKGEHKQALHDFKVELQKEIPISPLRQNLQQPMVRAKDHQA